MLFCKVQGSDFSHPLCDILTKAIGIGGADCAEEDVTVARGTYTMMFESSDTRSFGAFETMISDEAEVQPDQG